MTRRRWGGMDGPQIEQNTASIFFFLARQWSACTEAADVSSRRARSVAAVTWLFRSSSLGLGQRLLRTAGPQIVRCMERVGRDNDNSSIRPAGCFRGGAGNGGRINGVGRLRSASRSQPVGREEGANQWGIRLHPVWRRVAWHTRATASSLLLFPTKKKKW